MDDESDVKDLAGKGLNGSNLSRADLNGTNLPGANVSGVVGVDFSGASLE